MQIGFDEIGESTYHMKVKKKQMHLDRLIEICERVIDITFEQYQSFNVDLFAPVPSFEIHTTNKAQEVEYKAILSLCKELNLYKHPLPLQLQFLFNGDILLKGSEWIPNYNKIVLI